jgi:hypothetical protein
VRLYAGAGARRRVRAPSVYRPALVAFDAGEGHPILNQLSNASRHKNAALAHQRGVGIRSCVRGVGSNIFPGSRRREAEREREWLQGERKIAMVSAMQPTLLHIARPSPVPDGGCARRRGGYQSGTHGSIAKLPDACAEESSILPAKDGCNLRQSMNIGFSCLAVMRGELG